MLKPLSKKQKIVAFGTLIILSILVATTFYFQKISGFKPLKLFKPTPSPTPILVRAPLSGVLVSPEVAKRKIIAVVVENHPDARPQSGLNKASLIYETIAEGGITRFLAFFQEQEPSEIGPVRSARIAFLDWAREFKAIFAHVGGNADALNLLHSNQAGVFDLDEFKWGTSTFWRDSSRWAPHNAYTSIEKLKAAASASGYPLEEEIKGYPFKDDLPKEKRQPQNPITINFSGYQFAITYNYDLDKNLYLRNLAGSPHLDRVTGENLSAKNVVVMFAQMIPGVNYAGEEETEVQTIGSGKCLVFQDGKITEDTWQKSTKDSVTHFLDSQNQEIKFNAGQTWVEVIPLDTTVNY